ncbi:hypothetical protein F5Y09DRAFT_328316 [Xylaria sp. FL1042]|nr:hypothetical protein F5Y09DRAFT_328316 [Xylaria sp. FL1042]
MDACAELEKYAQEIASTTNHAIALLKQASPGALSSSSNSFPAHLDIRGGDVPRDLCRARKHILSSLKRFQIYLTQPADFIQQIAGQGQILACLRWLGDFQVLACIPLGESVSIKDIADLTGVSEAQLSRIVRITALAGFLREPMPGAISHTALSARFVTQYSFLDAAMFLAETGVPIALQTSAATRLQGRLGRDVEVPTSYSVAFNTSQAFPLAHEQSKKLQRQWPAFSRCLIDAEEQFTETLSQLDWVRIGDALIVHVCACSSEVAVALAQLSPTLQFIVQMQEPMYTDGKVIKVGRPNSPQKIECYNMDRLDPKISIQKRAPGSPQAVRDAMVYMFRLPTDELGLFSCPEASSSLILPELWAHMGILKANRAATFVLVAQLLPEPGSVDSDVEEAAHLRDLWKTQLMNGHEMKVDELTEMISSVKDGLGELVVVNKLQPRSSATVAFEIKYQDYHIAA